MSSEAEHKLIEYKECTPDGWEETVNEMPWVEVRKNVFRKNGRCPNCQGEFTFEVEMVFPLVPTDSVCYQCGCEFMHPGNEGKLGCGRFGNIDEPRVN